MTSQVVKPPTREQLAELVRELRDPNDTSLRFKDLAADWLELLAPNRDAMYARSDEEWAALEDAIGTLWGLEPGHVLTEDDVAGLRLMDTCHRQDEETATDAYHRGLEEGLRQRGGDELVALHKRHDEAILEKAAERAMRRLAEVRRDHVLRVLHALFKIRPFNWNDGDDAELEAAWKLAQDALGPPCVNHPHQPSVTNLDNEDLCQECANAWVKGEGDHAAWLEAQEAEAAEGSR